MSEDLQTEQAVEWIKKYGKWLLGLIAVLIIVFATIRYVSYREMTQKVAASELFSTIQQLVHDGQDDALEKKVSVLQHDYAKTPYASLAALLLAKNQLEQKKTQAIETFQWVIHNASSPFLQNLARIRLARVYLSKRQPVQVIALLKGADDPATLAMKHYLLGDAYQMEEKYQKARRAYQHALAEMDTQSPLSFLIRMKLNNLPVSQGGQA